MNLEQLIGRLKKTPSFMENVTHWETIPAKEASFAPFPAELDNRLPPVLAQRGVYKLYSHQREAFDLAATGKDICVVTPTASGKTMCYNLPVLNAILMPVVMALLASRLWDIEVKGSTTKLLYTLQSRRSLFAAKAALGLAEIFLIVTLEAAGAPLIGHLQHYTQPYPAAGQAAYLWGCTFAVDCMIFFSELLLTVLLANPLPALCVGILGTLLGLFSAFMPAWVGYFVPWGYFIPLNTYRIADWDQASKVVTYMIVPFQWPLLVATVVLAGILFFAAWYAMRNKEV